ncbi:MAG: hypothetical protein ABH875_04805 [Candidatus Omnitrophota bacterium]
MKKLLSLLLVIAFAAGSVGLSLADDDIPELPVLKERVEQFYKYQKADITITNGWNLIAMPVVPLKPYTVRQFIKDVAAPYYKDILVSYHKDCKVHKEDPQSQEKCYPYSCILRPAWKVLVVAVYKNGHFERYPKEGVTYNMVPGEAYFVYAEYFGIWYKSLNWRPQKTVTIPGGVPAPSISLNLDRGWSGRSILLNNIYQRYPYEKYPQRLYTLSELSKDLAKQGVKAKRIAFWSAKTQSWEQHELPYPYRDIPHIEYFKTLEDGLKVVEYNEDGKVSQETYYDIKENYSDLLMRLRVINPSDGFFLLCEENGLFMPSAWESYPFPMPYPPYPFTKPYPIEYEEYLKELMEKGVEVDEE